MRIFIFLMFTCFSSFAQPVDEYKQVSSIADMERDAHQRIYWAKKQRWPLIILMLNITVANGNLILQQDISMGRLPFILLFHFLHLP